MEQYSLFCHFSLSHFLCNGNALAEKQRNKEAKKQTKIYKKNFDVHAFVYFDFQQCFLKNIEYLLIKSCHVSS